MWIVRLFTGSRPPKGPAHIAGYASVWEPIRLEGDVTVHTGAHIPDEEPAAKVARTMVRSMKNCELAEDSAVSRVEVGARIQPPETVSDAVAASAAAQAEASYKHVVDTAFRNGWLHGDLSGTGQGGELGEQGGRSAVTGLTLAEMAMSRPPADWRTPGGLLARGRPPWESTDFHKPFPVWRPPAWREPPPPPPKDPTDPTDGPPSVAPGLQEQDTPVPGPEDSEDTDQGADPSLTDSGSLDEDSSADDAPDLTVLETYPPEDLPRAIRVVWNLYVARGETPPHPHPNAVNHLLKRIPLPTVSAAQIAAILSLPKPPPEASSDTEGDEDEGATL